MAKLHLERYFTSSFDEWNTLVEQSPGGTIFHRLDFLAYHGEKYAANEHHLLWRRKQKVVAALPLAIFDDNGQRVAKSPYGGSYGGVVSEPRLSLAEAEEIVLQLKEYLQSQHVSILRIVTPPSFYWERYSQYIDFFLIKHGAVLKSCDLTSYLPATPSPETLFDTSARNQLRQAERSNLNFHETDDIEQFYSLLSNNRAQFTPTHSLQELHWLKTTFPERFRFFVVEKDNEPIACTVSVACNKRVSLLFYWAHVHAHQRLRPMNILIARAIQWAHQEGFKWVDFGTQTVNMEPRYGGSQFKESFGATGALRPSYTLMF